MWTNASVLYQIYPFGAFGAPFENDHQVVHRLDRFSNWINHFKQLGIDAILFNPIFQSHTHGYDTIDYFTIDHRLGTNEDFIRVVQLAHDQNIKIILDGVFNHVGRGFFAFQDVLKHREASVYKDWFFVDFNGNNTYDDHLWYQDWEGNANLVKINLRHPDVIAYYLSVIDFWMDTLQIDGIRFDVAYLLDHDFLKTVRHHTKSKNPDFFLVGETLHGDYNVWVNDQMLDSCTNYECYKGLYSSFNSRNFFEILYSFNRQFGTEPWCLYTNKMLMNFVDNHDVSRIASLLENPNHLRLIYGMLLTMPGIPCLYYGSEWGIEGEKNWNDTSLRPEVIDMEWSDITTWIQQLISIKHQEASLHNASYKQIAITNTACIYERGDLFICINMDENPCQLGCDLHGTFTDLLSQSQVHIEGNVSLEGYQMVILKYDEL